VRPLLPESLTQLQKRVTSFTHFQTCCAYCVSSVDHILTGVNHVNFINNSVTFFFESKLNFRKIFFMKKIGLILIIIGFVLTVFGAFTFFTKEKVVDIGNVEITRNKAHHLNWSPLVGIAVMGIGGVVLWSSSKK